MNPGDGILYLGFFVGLIVLVALSYGQIKKIRTFDPYVKWLIRIFAALLFLDFGLLTYYFAVSDLTINYVWSYTSKYYPIYYKLSGTLAGQEGTLLFWALLIAIGSLRLGESKDSSLDFVWKTQLIVVSLGSYFIALTLLDSPFRTIYEVYPDISPGFIPGDGAGLNPLLLDPWMALHPFTMFVGYAGVTVPFAGAMVYLLKSLKGESGEVHKIWVSKVTQWSRIAWLFLTIAIAFGGIWSYKVLGWGGFWAWDPVETASLIPWLMLTAAVHTLAEHRKDKKKYSILAPLLISLSFALVIYATLVTRSGIFESVHAFMAGGAGPYLILLASLSFAAPFILAAMKYLKSESREVPAEASVLNRTNIFYLAILSFVALTFISFFGITYPAAIKMITGNKYGVGISFFNIWSYPFFIFLMLLAGLGLSYRQSQRSRATKEFLFFAFLTLIAALIVPSEDWNVVDYSAIISPDKPLLYVLIGSASALSFVPPSVYILYAAARLGKRIGILKERNARVKEVGILAVHLGIIFITTGAAFSVLFTSELNGILNINDRESIIKTSPAKMHQRIGTWGVHEGEGITPYGVKLLEYRQYADYKEGNVPPGISVAELYSSLDSLSKPGQIITVQGIVGEVRNFGNLSLLGLRDGNYVLWAAFKYALPEGSAIAVAGFLHSLDKGDLILFAEEIEIAQVNKFVQEVRLAVYKENKKIGEGVTKLEKYEKTDVRRVMIDRGLLGDIYVIFSGMARDEISLTIKLVPLVNFLWFGIILLAAGIAAVIFSEKEERSSGDVIEKSREEDFLSPLNT